MFVVTMRLGVRFCGEKDGAILGCERSVLKRLVFQFWRCFGTGEFILVSVSF